MVCMGLPPLRAVLISMGIFIVASKIGEHGIAMMGALLGAAGLGLFFVKLSIW